jgi:CRISPR-associated endonuclease Csn1
MLVSHRVTRRVSGPLHEETIYGPTDTPREFVYRKPVEALDTAMIEKIRDPAIRRIIVDHLRAHGVNLEQTEKIPAEAWRARPTMPSGVPIKRVRLVKRDQTIRPIRGGTAFIKTGSVHHVCLFDLPPGGKVRRKATFVSRLEVMTRLKMRQPLVSRTSPDDPAARFVMSLSRGELVLLDHDGHTDLYRVEKLTSTSRVMHFRHHTFAGKSADKRGQVSKTPNTLNAEKVTVDPLGRLRRARD